MENGLGMENGAKRAVELKSLFAWALLIVLSLAPSPGWAQGQAWNWDGMDPEAAQFLRAAENELLLNNPVFGEGNGPVLVRPFAEGIFLGRSDISGGTFVFDDSGPSLDYSDLSLGLENGYRVGFNILTPDESGIELAYMEHANHFSQVVDGPNVMPVFFNSIPAAPQPSYDINYDVDLESWEANYWLRRSPHTRYGGGFRIFDLREEFNILRTADPTTGFRADADNDLIGAQFLLEHRRPMGKGLQLVLGGKAGGYNNNVDARAFASNAQLHREDNSFSIVLDYRGGLRLDLNRFAILEFGYQGFFFSDVALAPTQSQTLDIFDPAANQIAFENVTFNGLYVHGSLTF